MIVKAYHRPSLTLVRWRTAAAILSAYLALALGAQPASADLPQTQPEAVTARSIDLTAYFVTRDVALNELSAVKRGTDAVRPYDQGSLYDYLRSVEGLLNRLRRVAGYFKVSMSRDLDDLAASDAVDRVDQCRGRLMADLENAIRAASPTERAALVRANGRYAFLIDKFAPEKRRLSEEASGGVATLSNPALGSFWKIYQRVDQIAASQKVSTIVT